MSTEPKPSEKSLHVFHDPEVEKSVTLYKENNSKYTTKALGFIRKNKLKNKTYQEICDILLHARTLKNGEIIGCGDRFKLWCAKFGRELPSDTLVDCMNADPAEANLLVVEALQTQATIYKSYCTYLSGRT